MKFINYKELFRHLFIVLTIFAIMFVIAKIYNSIESGKNTPAKITQEK